jgi:hypothetical protein
MGRFKKKLSGRIKRGRTRKTFPCRVITEPLELLKMGYTPSTKVKVPKKFRTTSWDITNLYKKNEDGQLVANENKKPIRLPKEKVLKKVA